MPVGGERPQLPTTNNAKEWCNSFVLKRLIAGQRNSPINPQQWNTSIEPSKNKKQKLSSPPPPLPSTSPLPNDMPSAKTPTIPSYWESDKARRLFAKGLAPGFVGTWLDRREQLTKVYGEREEECPWRRRLDNKFARLNGQMS